MSAGHEPARVLLAAAPPRLEVLRPLFASALFQGWTVVEADSHERAHFIGQMHPCEALVLDAELVGEDDVSLLRDALHKPLLLLGDGCPPAFAQLRTASWSWLPHEAVVKCPPLLADTLTHLLQVAEARADQVRTRAALEGSRRQVDGLVDLLWQVVPGELPGPWLSQRHMLERCEEEVARSHRHSAPLSVVLGEVRSGNTTGGDEPPSRWTAERICRAKRRSDIAGQYGPRGFMLLLPSTAATGAAACCRRLQQVLAAAPGGDEPRGPIQPSFGIADCTKEAPTVQALLRRAEEGLDQALAGGGQGLSGL